jgi:transposase-like protein
MRTAEATRKAEAEKRARAISEARSFGLSLEAIAQRLGVSRERVRQMAVKADDLLGGMEAGPGPRSKRLRPPLDPTKLGRDQIK